MKLQVEAVRRNEHMLSAMKGEGKAEHSKQRDTEVIPQFSSKQNRDQAEYSPYQLTLYAMVCLLGAKLSLLFKSLGRKWHRVQNFLKAQSEKGEFLRAKDKINKQSTDSSLGLTYGNPRCSGCCHQHPQ